MVIRKGHEFDGTRQAVVPNKLLRYIAIRVQEYNLRCTSEYMRQITKGDKRPSPALSIVLEDITGVDKADWLWTDQGLVNAELMENYPADGRWTEVLSEYVGVRV
jgi:hypothetical protein